MSAVERIQAAIDKLDKLKADSTPGPWVFQECDRRHVTHAIFGREPGQEVVGATANKGGLWYSADGELIVALHRTTDAQLAILRGGLAVAKHWVGIIDKLSGSVRIPLDHALLIADAILGPDSH